MSARCALGSLPVPCPCPRCPTVGQPYPRVRAGSPPSASHALGSPPLPRHYPACALGGQLCFRPAVPRCFPAVGQLCPRFPPASPLLATVPSVPHRYPWFTAGCALVPLLPRYVPAVGCAWPRFLGTSLPLPAIVFVSLVRAHCRPLLPSIPRYVPTSGRRHLPSPLIL